MKRTALQSLLPGLAEIMARDVRVIQDRGVDAGGDIDCAIRNASPMWPLRLPSEIRLCQALWYDTNATYYVIDAPAGVIAIDAVEDPSGLGKYGFPTTLFFADRAPIGADAHSAPRASYLTAKRARKRAESEQLWQRVGELAATAPGSYLEALTFAYGTAALDIGRAVLDGVVTPEIAAEMRRIITKRRLRTPRRAYRIGLRELQRIGRRLRRPSGMLVLVAGPDGSGKSSLAESLGDTCNGLFRRTLHAHLRVGVLPRPGRLARRPPGDPTTPHAQPPHPRWLSLSLLLYHWVDTLLGHWVRVIPFRARTGLVVTERGWWDLAVDPRRYRLNVPPTIVRALGALTPRPDLAVVLEADPATLVARKAELPADEVARQTREWATVLPASVKTVRLDASLSVAQVRTLAREEIVTELEARAISNLGAGWTSRARQDGTVWFAPRGPRAVASAATRLHRPTTRRGSRIARLVRGSASVGALRLLPRGSAPPREFRQLIAPFLPAGATYAVARTIHRGRYIALVISAEGRPLALAKVATDELGRSRLANEASALERIAPNLPLPLRAPTLIDAGPGVLITRWVASRPVPDPWRPRDDVLQAMGTFFSTSPKSPSRRGFAHGDFVPWNLLLTENGWCLVDWEVALTNAPPLFDVFHYLIQSHHMLGRPSHREIVAGLHGSGWISDAIDAYARGAGSTSLPVLEAFAAYVEFTTDERTRRDINERGIAIRHELLAATRP